jgi:uncharacterized protein
MNRTEEIIKKLKLLPHPEGGYFRETYRSTGEISINSQSKNNKGKRNYSTCIYFLLTSKDFSAFHKVKQDEIWHFYDGSPLYLHIISPKGKYSKIIIGNKIEKSQVPQFVVPGGHWFAASVIKKDSYSLVGCTVAPGFDFNDFELGDRSKLIKKFPEYKTVISRFTRL